MGIDELRYDWQELEIAAIFELPLPELIFRAQQSHRRFHHPDEIQGCSLLSVKTGGCPEDCSYCPQSGHFRTNLERSELMSLEEAVAAADCALLLGATRFCMGAAWRSMPKGEEFERVLEMIRRVRALGLEVCCTMGMLDSRQAQDLAAAGLTAYNHNLDTSPEYYGSIITTRAYADRIATLEYVRKAGITICCGGIIGMGETRADRYLLLQQLAAQRPHPESVPINLLVRVEGTPLADQSEVDPLELVRMIATARILMPQSIVRLSAGRSSLSDATQALCFVAGANSIFLGARLLTTPNAEVPQDLDLLKRLGMRLSPAVQGNAAGGHARAGAETIAHA
jgi:biotin synthase